MKCWFFGNVTVTLSGKVLVKFSFKKLIMADLPSVVFISCSDINPEEIIKLVLDSDELPERVQIDEDISAFPWHIDNKYYTAELRLCSLQKKSISNKNFADSVEAVVVHFDSCKKFALEEVDSWQPFINEFQPEIKILLCNSIQSEDDNSTTLNRRTALEWCINKGFELVELEQTLDANDELEDDFQETTGVKRIVQALNAHVWPNLVMKNPSQKVNPSKSVNQSQAELDNLRKQLLLEESLEELLDKDDDFSQLFCQLSEMKERVSSLSGSDRKAAAEQVVKAFWKALNGDDDEFLDL